MTDIVIFTEEASGKIVAESLAEKLGLADRSICLEHQGRSNLEQSFPRKISRWGSSRPPRFVIMRDNDGADCVERKRRLLQLVPREAAQRVKIRIVVQELESWYFGDLDAVFKAGLLTAAAFAQHTRKTRYRDPDSIRHAKEEFKSKIISGGQAELARLIAPHFSITGNKSRSFHSFVSALRWAAQAAGAP